MWTRATIPAWLLKALKKPLRSFRSPTVRLAGEPFLLRVFPRKELIKMTIATLGEGHTPIVRSVHIGPSLGLSNLYFKLESSNPSGSYKDRFAAAEVTRILRLGAPGCLATSSGNAGSALAAYCARYRISCAIVVNEHAPAGKLAQ